MYKCINITFFINNIFVFNLYSIHYISNNQHHILTVKTHYNNTILVFGPVFPEFLLFLLFCLWRFLLLDVPGVLNCEDSVSLRGVDKPLTSKTDVSFGADLKKTNNTGKCYFLLHDRNHFQNDSSCCLNIHKKTSHECFMKIIENFPQKHCH